MYVLHRIVAIAVVAAVGLDQPDVLVVADGLSRQTRALRNLPMFMAASLHPSFSVRRRSALAITETDDRLIAAAAIIGESSVPKTG